MFSLSKTLKKTILDKYLVKNITSSLTLFILIIINTNNVFL